MDLSFVLFVWEFYLTLDLEITQLGRGFEIAKNISNVIDIELED